MFLFRGFRFLSIAKVIRPHIHQAVQFKGLHLSAVSCVKKFRQTETQLTYKFVHNCEIDDDDPSAESKQHQNVFKPEASYEDKSLNELISVFDDLSYHCKFTESCLSNEIYNNFVNSLIKEIPNFKDEQLIQVLTALDRFPETPNVNSNNFHGLWMTLDDKCCDRLKDWKPPLILQFCNLWLKLNLSKKGHFSGKAITKICRRIDRLPSKTFVETMFYLTVSRTKLESMIEVEKRFCQVFHELDINEVGIISLTFFRTEEKIKLDELIDKIYDKTIKEVSSIPDITMANIMKILRYSSRPQHAEKMELLSNAIIPYIDRFKTICRLHIGLLGTNLQYCHKQLFEEIIVRFNRDVKTSRLKDIERISFAIGLFDFRTKSGVEQELLRSISDELKLRVNEVMLHPKCLATTAHYISILGIYDIEIIKSVLKEDYIKYAYGGDKTKIGREILCLDSLTRINLKAIYDGPQLSEKMRQVITKYRSHYVPYRGQPYRLTHSDQLLLNLKEFLERIYGVNILHQVLPHFQRPDVVYCFDENGNSVTDKLLDCLPPLYDGVIVTKEYLLSKKTEFADNIDKFRMVAVILGGWNFYLRGTKIPTGGLRMKMEQLEMIGYQPILIHWDDWLHMKMSEKEKLFEREIKRPLEPK